MQKIKIEKTPEFHELVEELKTIAGAFLPEIQRLDIDQHWYAGKMIVESKLYKRYGYQGVLAIKKARGFGISTINREIRFYEMFPDIEVTPGVLNYTPIEAKITSKAMLSWRIISNEVLIETRYNTKKKEEPKVKEIDKSSVRYLVEQTKASYLSVYDEGFKKLVTVKVRK